MKKIIVVSGRSAVGKDTVIRNLDGFQKYPSLTTRPKRKSEVDGVDYHFVDDNAFMKARHNGELLDTVCINGFFYGFPVEEFLLQKNGLWALNFLPESGLTFKRLFNETKLIYLELDKKTQLARMRARGMSDYEIGIRLKADPNPEKKPKYYDYGFINNESIETAKKVQKIIFN